MGSPRWRLAAPEQDQLDAERTEINRIDLREGHQVADTEADRSTMAARRWADASPCNGKPHNGTT